MFKIYTDGSVLGNPGPSAYGYVVLSEAEEILHETVGTWEKSTNQRAELQAIVSALQWVNGLTQDLKRPLRVTVYSDSQYAIKCLSEWWPKWERQGWMRKVKGKAFPVKNLDIIKAGVEAQRHQKVVFQWVKGHSGNKWNEYVDQMVSTAAVRAGEIGIMDAGYDTADTDAFTEPTRFKHVNQASLFA